MSIYVAAPVARRPAGGTPSPQSPLEYFEKKKQARSPGFFFSKILMPRMPRQQKLPWQNQPGDIAPPWA